MLIWIYAKIVAIDDIKAAAYGVSINSRTTHEVPVCVFSGEPFENVHEVKIKLCVLTAHLTI